MNISSFFVSTTNTDTITKQQRTVIHYVEDPFEFTTTIVQLIFYQELKIERILNKSIIQKWIVYYIFQAHLFLFDFRTWIDIDLKCASDSEI